MNHNRFNSRIIAKRNRVALAAQGSSKFAGAGVVPSVIDQGRATPFRKNGALHRNAINLKLINNDGVNRADIILTGGMFAALAAYAAQVVTDGTNATTNDTGDTVSVDVVCKYGVDGSLNWEHIQTRIREDGIAVAGLSLRVQTQEQLSNKFMLIKRDDFGNHFADVIDPEIEYNPDQYDGKLVRMDVGFPLTKDYVLKYSLEPDETVTLQLFLDGIHKPHARIEQAAIAGGEVAGL